MSTATIYQENAILTQNNNLRIVVMLYDGAVRFLRQAKSEIAKGNMEAKGEYIVKAQDIIFELNSVLDMEQGGQVSQNLRQLYNYMWQRLGDANMQCDPGIIDEVIPLLEELNRGWKELSQK